MRAHVARAAQWARRQRRPRTKSRYDAAPTPIPLIERLTDDELEVLNELLPWQSFTVDALGRPFGRAAWVGKRVDPEPIPDPRILRFHQRFDLSDKHVLEIGCFEGAHTAALCSMSDRVTAVDARVENVVKTIVRCAFFGQAPTTLTADVETLDPSDPLLRADVCHHVGVLYHLADPIRHLRNLGAWADHGLMLDTHYATERDVTGEYDVDGRGYRFRHYVESGRADAFSGVKPHAKWLLLDDIVSELANAGFPHLEMVERREERNGPRVLLFAAR